MLILPPTIAAGYAFAQEEVCKLKKDKDDIKIYACHTDTSRFKSIRADVIIRDVSIGELKAHLMDAENYVTWQYKMEDSRLLQRISDSELIMRTVVDAPWPVNNREVITRLKVSVNKAGTELAVEGKVVAHEYPPEKGLVRVPFSRSHWRVNAINGNDLKVEYFLTVDPGGSIPAWLVNLAVAEGPYESFRNLITQLSNKKDAR